MTFPFAKCARVLGGRTQPNPRLLAILPLPPSPFPGHLVPSLCVFRAAQLQLRQPWEPPRGFMMCRWCFRRAPHVCGLWEPGQPQMSWIVRKAPLARLACWRSDGGSQASSGWEFPQGAWLDAREADESVSFVSSPVIRMTAHELWKDHF